MFLRVAMSFIKNIRVCKKRPQTGISAEQDRSSPIFAMRIIGRVCIAEDTSAQGDKLFAPYFLDQNCALLIDHSNKHFKSVYMQFL